MPYYLLADIVVTSIIYKNVGNLANTLKLRTLYQICNYKQHRYIDEPTVNLHIWPIPTYFFF